MWPQRNFGHLVAASLVITLAVCGVLGAAEGNVVKVRKGEAAVEGLPLAWGSDFAAVLRGDGALFTFNPREVTVEKSTRAFEPYTTMAMRRALEREFGSAYDVTAAGHYLVVHPRGQGQAWASRFDELYRGFQRYFNVRGFTLKQPQFPLVAVVLRTREDYLRYLEKHAPGTPTSTLGFYSPATNRVVLYDAAGGSDANWHLNAETIIHEATHQTAFNTGLHNRFGATPRWVAEGLGMLFEARGVWSGRANGPQSERIQPQRLADFRKYVQNGRSEDALAELIASDQPFRRDMHNAYAESWALTFFLSETRPREYARYLARVAARPNFQSYPSQERLADFTAIFGSNLRHLDAQFLRYMQELR